MAWMEQVREFVKDVRVESSKVSWPTRNELRDSTVVVIVTVLIVMVFVGAVDRFLGWAVAPALAPGGHPGFERQAILGAGLVWQFVLVLVLIGAALKVGVAWR